MTYLPRGGARPLFTLPCQTLKHHMQAKSFSRDDFNHTRHDRCEEAASVREVRQYHFVPQVAFLASETVGAEDLRRIELRKSGLEIVMNVIN